MIRFSVIEEAEPLCQRECIFPDSGGLERHQGLVGDLVQSKRHVEQFPNVVRFVQVHRELRIVEESMEAVEIKLRIGLATCS